MAMFIPQKDPMEDVSRIFQIFSDIDRRRISREELELRRKELFGERKDMGEGVPLTPETTEISKSEPIDKNLANFTQKYSGDKPITATNVNEMRAAIEKSPELQKEYQAFQKTSVAPKEMIQNTSTYDEAKKVVSSKFEENRRNIESMKVQALTNPNITKESINKLEEKNNADEANATFALMNKMTQERKKVAPMEKIMDAPLTGNSLPPKQVSNRFALHSYEYNRKDEKGNSIYNTFSEYHSKVWKEFRNLPIEQQNDPNVIAEFRAELIGAAPTFASAHKYRGDDWDRLERKILKGGGGVGKPEKYDYVVLKTKGEEAGTIEHIPASQVELNKQTHGRANVVPAAFFKTESEFVEKVSQLGDKATPDMLKTIYQDPVKRSLLKIKHKQIVEMKEGTFWDSYTLSPIGGITGGETNTAFDALMRKIRTKK